MFWSSSTDLKEFMDVSISFVSMLREDTTHTVTERTSSNQNLSVDYIIWATVNVRTAAYNARLVLGNMTEYKAACYTLWCAVKTTKLWYRGQVESDFQLNNSRHLWQGLRTISTFRGKSSIVRSDSTMADELNTFYACFEANHTNTCLPTSATERSGSVCNASTITILGDEVQRALKNVNIRKAASPNFQPCTEILHWLASWIVHFYLQQVHNWACGPHLL